MNTTLTGLEKVFFWTTLSADVRTLVRSCINFLSKTDRRFFPTPSCLPWSERKRTPTIWLHRDIPNFQKRGVRHNTMQWLLRLPLAIFMQSNIGLESGPGDSPLVWSVWWANNISLWRPTNFKNRTTYISPNAFETSHILHFCTSPGVMALKNVWGRIAPLFRRSRLSRV